MKERIAITGSNGIIGTILKERLSNKYQISAIDLPKTDIRDYRQLLEAVRGNNAIIHLAWDSTIEHSRSSQKDPNNEKMYSNVFKAAFEDRIARVIMASSIHADNFYGFNGPKLMSPYRKPDPQTPYGEDKVFMENLGRTFASKGLEVVIVRFGGINPQNRAPVKDKPEDMATWLSNNDCVSLIDATLKAKIIPNNFVIVYGVSDNAGRVSDVSNPFGWHPRDRAEDFV